MVTSTPGPAAGAGAVAGAVAAVSGAAAVPCSPVLAEVDGALVSLADGFCGGRFFLGAGAVWASAVAVVTQRAAAKQNERSMEAARVTRVSPWVKTVKLAFRARRS